MFGQVLVGGVQLPVLQSGRRCLPSLRSAAALRPRHAAIGRRTLQTCNVMAPARPVQPQQPAGEVRRAQPCAAWPPCHSIASSLWKSPVCELCTVLYDRHRQFDRGLIAARRLAAWDTMSCDACIASADGLPGTLSSALPVRTIK